jgi:uncharacterized repeat protein (TIGR03803 family)
MKHHGKAIVIIAGTLLAVGARVAAAQQETILHAFCSPLSEQADGLYPSSGVIRDIHGNVYGTTLEGGNTAGPAGTETAGGAVFELSFGQTAPWPEALLYTFEILPSGYLATPGPLIFDGAGNLYGTTFNGANGNPATNPSGSGVVFELSLTEDGTWTETVLYSFNGGDGMNPGGALIFDGAGNLYGTTSGGGANSGNYINPSPGGTVFELSPVSGGGWTEKVLYSFGASATDGNSPLSGLIFDASGNLYGTTSSGGAHGSGTVFELTPAAGGAWTEKVLYSFGADDGDGADPSAGLTIDAKGNFYGTTPSGGISGGGTVFELRPGAGGVWTENILYTFSNGVSPTSGVIFDAYGNLYGETGGVVFELIPAASGVWTEQVLHTFSSKSTVSNGVGPEGGLIFDPSGNLYGTTYWGGCGSDGAGYGTVFEISAVTTAAPVFSPPAGAYPPPQPVTITDATAGATIYYTTNGDTPTASSTRYTAPITVSATETIQAIAVTPENQKSAVATATYTIEEPAATPQFSVPSGTYTSPQTVTITDAIPTATIYYTTNGTVPSTSSAKYTAPITVSATETIIAIAYAAGFGPSKVAMAAYTIALPIAATPVITPIAGMYPAAQLITITDATPGAVIYYSGNRLPQAIASDEFTHAIEIRASVTIEAFAVAPGYTNSAVATAAYTLVGSPSALAAPAGGISGQGATLYAIVDTLGLSGSYVFRYGRNSRRLDRETERTALSASAGHQSAAAQVAGLESGTTYYFRVVVTTEGGTAESAVLSFTTGGPARIYP